MNMTGIIFSEMYSGELGTFTYDRNMAAIPFGGRYRLVDFVLSNMVNSGITNVGVLATQHYHSLNQVSTTVYAPASGVYSAGTDGWEGVATPGILDNITADGLDELLHQQHSPAPGTVGKLITDSTWYYAALLDGTGTGLQSGRRYTLSFSGDYFGQLSMTLERVVLDGDRTLAVFSCRSHLADTTLLRLQTVDVVTQRIEGIRVPRQALRVETVDEPLESGNPDGPTRQVNRYKVYIVERSQAWGREVEILYTDENFYLVRPVDQTSAGRLRAGDEIILNSSGVYDGKVVR